MDFCRDSERLRSPSGTECLELAYQENLRQSDFIVKDEGARRLRLQVLLLEDENDDLHEQLAIDDDRIDVLELEMEDLQKQLEDGEAQSQRRESEMRLQVRELNNMKAELNSMNGLSVDSTRLLTEKLSLARELATLKPELEHLRNQATYQQTVLADKLALQRQVNTLEVELETEKRALKRASRKEKDREMETELQKELDEVRKELAKEKKDRDMSQHATEKGSTGWEARNTILENKVELLKSKLRETKEQLKDMRTELAQAQAQLAATKSTVPAEGPAKKSRKRDAHEMSTDATIGTPDGVAVRGRRPGLNRGRPESTLLGEKSMFSITPYLNRTAAVAPETPREEVEILETEGKDDESKEKGATVPTSTASHRAPESKKDTSKFPAKSDVQQKATVKNVLKESKVGTTNSKAVAKKQRMMGTLEKVTEEDVDENLDGVVEDAVKVDRKESAFKTHTPTIDQEEPKKKKRKLLGIAKTLFDEEDGEATKRPAKVILGTARSLGRVGTKPSSGAFGAFSPLKKEKRGLQASFLL